jgi:hypothetical protein
MLNFIPVIECAEDDTIGNNKNIFSLENQALSHPKGREGDIKMVAVNIILVLIKNLVDKTLNVLGETTKLAFSQHVPSLGAFAAEGAAAVFKKVLYHL